MQPTPETAGFAVGDRLPNFVRSGPDGKPVDYYRDRCGVAALVVPTRESPAKLPDELSRLDLPVVVITTLRNADPDPNTQVVIDDGAVVNFMLAEGQTSRFCLVDANARLLAAWETWPGCSAVIAQLPPLDDGPIVTQGAPALIIPRVFDTNFCQELIGAFHQMGNEPSGVFHMEKGELVYRADPEAKIRREHRVEDRRWKQAIESRLARRVLPEIQWAYQFQVTGYEGFKVVSYAADDGGFFSPHRDNDGPDTAHRRFALTLNLNTDDYMGGELRFPEYGRTRYRAPTGAAVVFSCSLAHEALPVSQGTRYALVSFFYGAGDQVQRAQYKDKVSG